MSRKKSILAAILVIFATFLVSFSSLAATPKAESYTQAQIERIQKYIPPIAALSDRLPELQALIQKRNWIDVGTFIHGPLGELRQDMAYLTRNLLPKDQEAARQASKEIFGHFEAIDKAAAIGNYEVAVTNYREVVKDINAFLKQVPQG